MARALAFRQMLRDRQLAGVISKLACRTLDDDALELRILPLAFNHSALVGDNLVHHHIDEDAVADLGFLADGMLTHPYVRVLQWGFGIARVDHNCHGTVAAVPDLLFEFSVYAAVGDQAKGFGARVIGCFHLRSLYLAVGVLM